MENAVCPVSPWNPLCLWELIKQMARYVIERKLDERTRLRAAEEYGIISER